MPADEKPPEKVRTHDVFVSYSSEDIALAEEAVRVLEAAGIRCWIAKRDILPGSANWAAEIEKAIREARAMVLLVSPDFNRSVQTPKEIILGIDERLRILPIRAVDFQPWGHLRYFLADRQWVDASGDKFAPRLDSVASLLRGYLARGPAADAAQPGQPLPEGLKQAKELGILIPGAFLKLEMTRPLRLSNEQPSLWLQAYNALVPMTGREPEVEELFQMLRADGSFRWRVFFGEAGMGKTRLAIEFVRKAMSEGWHAGFLSSNNLKLFVSDHQAGAWRPCVPTLIVVDYAASKVAELRRLFEHLAAIEAEAQQETDGAPSTPPVRVLLLERHADETRGWLYELLAAGESVTGDLLSSVCYLGVRKLQPPGGNSAGGAAAIDLTQQIVKNAFAGWAAVTGRNPPPLPEFNEKDWRSIQLRTGNRPLYLQMAAIHACEHRSAVQLPTWGRGDLLLSAVERERKYVQKECAGNPALCKAVEHVTAILCLAGGGAARGRHWIQAVGEKLDSIGVRSIDPDKVEQQRRDIFAEAQSGLDDFETAVIQPDIVSEGFAAQVLYAERGEPPIETLKQALRLSGDKAWANLVRMVQDLAGLESKLFRQGRRGAAEIKPIDSWLPPLLADRPVEELYRLINLIPERSISLHRFALIVNEHLLGRLPACQIAERADCLLSIATHRCRMSSSTQAPIEQAIQELKDAIGLFSQLPLDDSRCGCRLKLAKTYRMLDNAHTRLSNNEEAARNAAIGARLASGGGLASEPPLETAAAQDLASLQTPGDPESMLEFANCLNNLNIDLRALKRNPEALAIGQRAVAVGEQLKAHDYRRFAPDLARYLNNLSLTQSDASDMAGAISNSRESARIRAEFARENPDEFAQPLSLTLDHLVKLEYSEKNAAGAQAATEQLIAVYEDLSARDPASYRGQLADCYHNIGYFCDQNENKPEGIRYTLEAIRVREELLDSDFDSQVLALARSHSNAGLMFREQGDLSSALAHHERAYDLRLQWVARAPGRQLAKLDNSAKLIRTLCRELKQPEREAACLQRMAEYAETTNQPPGERGMVLHNLARDLGELGKTAQAAAVAKSSARDFRDLFTASSPEADLSEWANSGCNLASALDLQGDWSADEPVLAQAIGICRQVLARIKPEEDGLSFTWGALMNNLGHAQYRQGELQGRIDGVRQGLDALKTSAEHHSKQGNKAAAEETNALVLRAQEALAKMEQTNLEAAEPSPPSEG